MNQQKQQLKIRKLSMVGNKSYDKILNCFGYFENVFVIFRWNFEAWDQSKIFMSVLYKDYDPDKKKQ